MTWSFHSQVGDEGWLVTLDSARLDRVVGRFQEEVLDGVLVFQSVLPSMKIGRDGQFVGLADYAHSRGTLRTAVLGALPETVDRSTAAQLIDSLLDERRLEQAARNTWATLVSSASGQTLAVDKVHKISTEVAIPATGGLVAFDGEVRARGPLPCFVGDERSRCIWLEMESRPNLEALSKSISQTPTNPAATLNAQVKFVSARYKTEAVLEADRLLPHWFHLMQTTDLSIEQGGKTLALHQVQDRIDAFHYQDP
jgi:hypothetical protein